jgi:hypothetical protein
VTIVDISIYSIYHVHVYVAVQVTVVTAQRCVLDAIVATVTSAVLILKWLCPKTFDFELALQMTTRLPVHQYQFFFTTWAI